MTKRLVSIFVLALFGTLALAQQLPVPNILDTASSHAREVASLFWWVTGFSVIVLAVVVAFMWFGIRRAIHDNNTKEEGWEPEQVHGNLTLEVTWTLVPLLILGVLLVLTVGSIYRLDGFAAPEESIQINVVGQQYWWEMAYLEEGVVTANELVVPVGQPVRLNLTSRDVMHSFWVPQIAGKTDLIPGNRRAMWFTADREGIFYGQCAELCGDSHANMRLRIIALAPDEYARWVEAAQQPAQVPSNVSQGAQLFVSKGCIGCHAVQGVNTYNRSAPDLSHFGSRTSLAAGMLENNRDNLIRWLRYTDVVKPGVAMPNLGLTQEEAEALADYMLALELPDVDLRAMIGDQTATVPTPDTELSSRE